MLTKLINILYNKNKKYSQFYVCVHIYNAYINNNKKKISIVSNGGFKLCLGFSINVMVGFWWSTSDLKKKIYMRTSNSVLASVGNNFQKGMKEK